MSEIYTVNATVTYSAWIDIEADTPDAALEAAREYSADAFEYDSMTGEVEFNVEPAVELA